MKYLLSVLLVFFISCSNSNEISKHEYKDLWPFLVNSGQLECRKSNEIVFIYKDDIYALNYNAIKSKKYLSVESLRRRNPPPSNTKISMKSVISKAKGFCR